MGISTSDKPFLERVEEAKQDHFMQAAVAKAQDAQFIKRTQARREMGHWNEWRDLAAQIREIGAQHMVLSTDLGQTVNPEPAAMFEEYVRRLVEAGVTEEEMRQMIVQNPSYLVE